MTDHRTRNDASRQRLASIAGRVAAGDASLRTAGEWPPGAVLAHLAFWDRLVLARWERAAARREAIPAALPDDLGELLNDAGAPAWRALPAAEAARLAVEAAEACDARVATATEAQLAALEAAGMARLAERSHHRGRHLDAMEGREPGA